MAKKSMIAREVKRKKLAAQYGAQRAAVKQRVTDESLSYDDRWEAMIAASKVTA